MQAIFRPTIRLLQRRHLRQAAASSFATSRSASVLTGYKNWVSRGELAYDEKQFAILQLFDKLQRIIVKTVKSANERVTETVKDGKVEGNETADNKITHNAMPPLRLRGVYLYGEVGTGKTMLMDQFYHSLDPSISTKRRVHFHDFMLEIHKRIHLHKKQLIEQYGRDINLNLCSERDSIIIIAREIAREARVLCFDEFQVTDICDAMILSRLFGELWKQGVVLVATSNRHPSELYLNGLNRQYFLPFIEQLQGNCIVRNIGIDKDYRQDNVSQQGSYLVPDSAKNNAKLWDMYNAELVKRNQASKQETVAVMMGRTLTLQHANLACKACYVSFAELCDTDKGASDYQSLCAHYRTIYMHSIPQLSVLSHNEARRFITLIDAMYNNNVRFVWTAAARPAQLFRVLTTAEVFQQQDNLGTDHLWSTTDAVNAIDKDSTTCKERASDGSGIAIMPSTKQHLRGGEQARIPLDSNVYFGSTIKLTGANGFNQSDTVVDASCAGSGEAGSKSLHTASTNSGTAGAAAAVDAGQEELKVLEGELASIRELSFAFKRAASRLTEMSSVGYVERWGQHHPFEI